MVGMPSSLRILASVPAENIWGLTWHWYQWLVCCEKIGLKCFIHTFLWIFYSDLETIFPESRTESWIPGVILTHLSERLNHRKKEIHLEAKWQEKVHCPPPYNTFAHAIAYNDYKPGSCSDLSSFGARTLWFLCLLPSASPVSLYPVIIIITTNLVCFNLFFIIFITVTILDTMSIFSHSTRSVVGGSRTSKVRTMLSGTTFACRGTYGDLVCLLIVKKRESHLSPPLEHRKIARGNVSKLEIRGRFEQKSLLLPLNGVFSGHLPHNQVFVTFFWSFLSVLVNDLPFCFCL